MKHQQRQEDILFSVCIFFGAFAINLLIRKLFTTQTLVPMIFVFGVFLISLKTHGYCYGIVSAVLSVFAVNFAFTYPYYTLDFFVEESILSAIIMLLVAVSTSTLNSRIRDQENLRAESEKERMRGNLLRAISHDLRTPLTSIYGSASTLISKKDALSEEQQLKLLGEIQEDSEWLIRMVENLLAVTRIDGAKVKIVKTPIVLDELIDSVLMKFSKKHPNQKVITQIPADFVDIPMDSILIEQVLLNFLENAVFHAKGMTELKLSVSLAGDKAVFEVADNGCGIPEEILDKIFTGCCDCDLSFLKIAMLISCLHFSFYSGCNIPILGSRLCQHRIIVNIHIGFGDITFRDHTFQHPVSCDRKCMRIHLGHLFPCSTNGQISVNLFAFP